MCADKANSTIKFRLGRWIEIVSYAIISLVLIGQILYVEDKVTALNTMLVFAGIFVGMMASCGWTPLSNKLRDPEILISGNVVSFIRPEKEGHKRTDEDKSAA